MPDATITSTASTFGSISGTFAADQSTIAGTITAITGTVNGSVGVPGPQGPAGSQGPQGPQGDPGAPGVGVPADGLEGQILAKASDTSYDTVWIDNSAVTLNATVRNESGSTMAAGTVVYITGASGNKAVVSKASASSEATSSKTFAILAESIPNNQNGTSVTVGLLKDINTSGLTEGGSLWLSTTAGQWTQTPPTAPNHAVFLGTVTRVHATQGEVEVRIQNGYELQELHNVKITSVANGQVLKYDSAQGLWVNGTDSSGVAWGAITGTLSSQTDLQTALDAKLPKAGGYITGDIQSSNNSAYRSWDGTYNTSVLKSDYLQLTNSGPGGNALTIEWNGITFPSGKQTVHYPGTSILSGYATESWVTSNFYPLTGNPSGFLTSASLSGYATESWVTSQGYLTSASLSGYATQSWVTSQGYLTSSALTGYATQAWVDAQGYLQAGALTGYALESWVTAGFYPLTGNPSGFITSSALTGYATESWVTSQGYLTDAPSDGNQYARKNGAWDIVSAPAAYITSVSSPLSVTSGNLTIDLTGYATETFVTTQGYVDSAYVASALSGYATESWVTAGFYPLTGNPSGFLTSASLSGYATLASPIFTGDPRAPTPATADNDTSIATTAFVKAQGYLTSAPVISVAGKTGAVTLVVGDVSGAAPLASPSLTGTPLSTTAAADTNTTQIATTAFVVGQAGSATPLMDNGTAVVGTSLRYARQDHVHPTDTSRAALNSPAFTGTPSLPTGTIAVTQSAGNNTTAVATTAFVTAAVPTFAATADINSPSSTTVVMSPKNVVDLILNANYQMLYYGAGVSGSSGTGAGFGNNGGRWHDLASPSAAISGYGAWSFDTNASSVGLAGTQRGANPISKNWAKKIWMAGRCSVGNYPNSTLDGDTNTFFRIGLGGKTSFASGDMSAAQSGIGFKLPGGGASAMILQVSNGTTLTNVTSSFTPAARQVFDWKIYSDGAGNVTLYINDSSVATTTAGPTNTQNYGLYFEMADSNGSNTKQLLCSSFGTKIYYST